MRPAVGVDVMPGDILALVSDGVYEYHDRHNEQFGEERVEAILQTRHTLPMAELSSVLLAEVEAFARGAPQEDDITIVLVKREGGAETERPFRRSFDSLEGIFEFSAEFFAGHAVDPGLLPTVDLVLEELFTNMVKYSPGGEAFVRIAMRPVHGGVDVTLTDYDVERFDVTQAPDADINLPIEKRTPGGLGLHLIRRLVDSMRYEYSNDTRQSRITFRKTKPHEAGGTTS
jgi:anti-sigma regulatory factor (Ser/Thr protein kinase)